MNLTALFLTFFLATTTLLAQKTGTLLVVTNTPADVTIDGKSKGRIDNQAPLSLQLQTGEHLVVVKAAHAQALGQEKKQVVVIATGQQSLVDAEFALSELPSAATLPSHCVSQVADMNFVIKGKAEKEIADWIDDKEVLDWIGMKKDKDSEYFFAFAANDLLKISFSLDNKQASAGLKVSNYETKEVVYFSENLSDIGQLNLTIPKKGVYKFQFYNKSKFNKKANFVMWRESNSPEACQLNTTVNFMEVYDTTFETVPEKIYHAVAVTDQLIFSLYDNGKERSSNDLKNTTIELNLPANTVNWYYTVVGSYSPAGIQNIKTAFSLKQYIDNQLQSNNSPSIAYQKINAPQGDAPFNLYLTDLANAQAFKEGKMLTKSINTRIASTSAVLYPKGYNTGTWYLCLEPSKAQFNTYLAVEIVAITEHETGNMVTKIKDIKKKQKPIPIN